MPGTSRASAAKPVLRRVARKAQQTVGNKVSAKVGPKASGGKPPRRPKGSCLVCGSLNLETSTIHKPTKGRVSRNRLPATLNVIDCRDCGYVSSPDASYDYAGAKKGTDLSNKQRKRSATVEKPGRETAMAKLGLQALSGRRNASVLVYGAGQSLDVHHIGKLKRVGRVAIGDMAKIRDDVEFFDVGKPSPGDQFDVVVASEVLEHFPDPWDNFGVLFSFVKDDGIVVASTNIRNDDPLDDVNYFWNKGHVSYYSPKALRMITKGNGMHLDFRFPLIATTYSNTCKRYVIMSKSEAVMEAIADRFGTEVYAPSESLPPAPESPAEVTLPADNPTEAPAE